MKKLIVKLHKWISIIFGIYFVALGLSGSYITYPEVFESWLNPKLYNSESAYAEINLSAVVKTAQTALQTTNPPMSVKVPDSNGKNIIVTINTADNPKGRKFEMAFIDPSTMQFKGKQSFIKTPAGFLFIFHHELFAGRIGHTLVAIGGLLLLITLLTGLYWWWPKNGKTWKQALTLPSEFKSMMHFNIITHKVGGAYSMVLMLLVTVTGIYLAKSDWFAFLSNESKVEVAQSTFNLNAQTNSETSEDALTALQNWMNTNQISIHPLEIRTPRGKDFYVVNFKHNEEAVELKLDKVSHELTLVEKTQRDEFDKLIYNLHAGEFWSFWGRILVFISGLLPLFFFVSGIYIWLKKPKKSA